MPEFPKAYHIVRRAALRLALTRALVKAAHRTPFTVAGDWTRLDENRMSAALVAAANAISGRGSVARAEIIAQNPRLRAARDNGRCCQ